MITDSLKNASCYLGLRPELDLIFRYIAEQEEALKALPAGPAELPEELKAAGISMKVVEFETVVGTRKWESHRKYGFLYYVLEGRERTGYSDISRMGPGIPTEGKDQIIYPEGNGDRILVPEGHFITIFPQDGHMSKLADGESSKVRKCSFKFRWDRE